MVLLSGRGEKEARRCEQIVQDAGIQWTLVRSSWFCQNFSESFMLEPIQSGEVALPAGNVSESFIDAEDIADIVVAALTEDGHAGRLYEVTGPRLLTFAQALEQIAETAGRPIRFVQVSVEEYAAGHDYRRGPQRPNHGMLACQPGCKMHACRTQTGNIHTIQIRWHLAQEYGDFSFPGYRR
jgi:nucleoside-diphosphate-sugar epimerase